MSPNKQSYNLALVGAGRQGMAILEALVPPRRADQPLRLVGVADLNPEAPGIVYARRYNLPVFQSFLDLIKLPAFGYNRQLHRPARGFHRTPGTLSARDFGPQLRSNPTLGGFLGFHLQEPALY